jgi:hypothetical protein
MVVVVLNYSLVVFGDGQELSVRVPYVSVLSSTDDKTSFVNRVEIRAVTEAFGASGLISSAIKMNS